jgi:hypothetical protein
VGAFVAAVPRRECTHTPFTSRLTPISRPYLMTIVAVDTAGIEMLIERAGAVVFNGAEEGIIHRPTVFRVAVLLFEISRNYCSRLPTPMAHLRE